MDKIKNVFCRLTNAYGEHVNRVTKLARIFVAISMENVYANRYLLVRSLFVFLFFISPLVWCSVRILFRNPLLYLSTAHWENETSHHDLLTAVEWQGAPSTFIESSSFLDAAWKTDNEASFTVPWEKNNY